MMRSPLETLLQAQHAELFQSIATQRDVFRPDPFDVDAIHADAREEFDALVTRAANTDRPGSGAILLVLGDSGAGKTHLMRAFRNRVHSADRGFVCYTQMTSNATNYARFILRNALDSLAEPYDIDRGDRSGLILLSDRLCEVPGACTDEELEELRGSKSGPKLHQLVQRISQRLIHKQNSEGRPEIDPEILQALLLLQRRYGLIDSAVQKYLKCQRLSRASEDHLGGLRERTHDEDPGEVLRNLARVVAMLDGGAIVLCIDQLEDGFSPDENSVEKFRRTMLTLREFTDASPNVVVVIACLEDYWAQLRQSLSKSIVDRIEQSPPSVRLHSNLEPDQIQAVVEARLHGWLEEQGCTIDANDPLAPFDAAQLHRLDHMRTRDILVACEQVTKLARKRGLAPDFGWLEEDRSGTSTRPSAPETSGPSSIEWTIRWDQFRSEYDAEVPEQENDLAQLLAETLTEASCEIGPTASLECHAIDNRVAGKAKGIEGLPVSAIAICDRATRGGGLQRQIESALLQLSHPDERMAVLRTSEFPTNPKTKIAQALGQLSVAGHRRAQCSPTHWGLFAAMRAFHAQHRADESFLAWRRTERPVLSQQCLADALDGPSLREIATSAERTQPATRPSSTNGEEKRGVEPPDSPAQPSQDDDPNSLRIGTSVGLEKREVRLSLQGLKRHSAFLGGSGSGKTTLALSILESATLRGVPALLIDRKGDLGSYADPAAWDAIEPEYRQRAERLRARLDVQLYTPGEPNGRDLAVPLLPHASDRLGDRERESLIRHYAAALVSLMGVSKATVARTQTILGSGLEVLDALRDPSNHEPLSVADLANFLRSGDPALFAKLPSLDQKKADKTAADLDDLSYTQPILRPEPGTELLDVPELLGLRRPRVGAEDRCRVSILNLSGLPSDDNVLFFVTHVLTGLKRLSTKSPSEELQALVLLDEADLYLPATRVPPTKPLLEDGLKRFRSGGIGLMLGTQSPGDLDYKGRENIHTWFLGGIRQDRALQKLQPMFRDGTQVDQLRKLDRGQFVMLKDGQPSVVKADRNVIETRQLSADQAARLAQRSS